MAVNISKRAAEENKIKQVVRTLWKPNRGFFENLFRLAPYIAPFFGVPWWQLIAANIGTHILGVSTMDMGRLLDKELGTGPGETFDADAVVDKATAFVENLIQKHTPATASDNQQLTKEASIFSLLLKSGKLAGWFAKGLAKIIGGLLALFGMASVDDFIRDITTPLRDSTPTLLPVDEPDKEPVKEDQPEPVEERPFSYREQKSDIETMIDKLQEKYNLGV